MIKNFIFTVYIISILITFIKPAFARCAVCYTNGMSGASIAVLVIVSSFVILFISNLLLKKILNK